MSTAGGRDAILGSIRRSLGRGPLDEAARAAVDERIAKPTPNIVPARTDIPQDERVDLFTSMAEAVFATVDRVSGPDAVPGAVADYLAQHNLPPALVMAPDPALDAYPWGERPMLAIRRGRAEEADRVGVTGAVMGFAETGTLDDDLRSRPSRPRSTSCRRPTSWCCRRRRSAAPTRRAGRTCEPKAVRTLGGGFMPRTVNLVTGPSRTADIEQTIALGAHGPRRLHIVIVEGDASHERRRPPYTERGGGALAARLPRRDAAPARCCGAGRGG